MPRGLQAAQAQGSMDFKSYIRSSQALENLEKQLICPICVEMFSKPVVILPCQHNLCRKCAGEIFQTRGSTVGSGGRFRCPACRHEVLLDRHGVYGLQRNLLVENIIDIYKHESARPPSRSRRPSCEEHEEEKINIYCESCQIPICSLCKVFGTHQDCKVLPLTTVYQAQKAQLSDGIAVLMTGNDHIQKVLREMDKASRSVEESGRRSRQILCESFDALSSALHARRQAMLGAVLAAQESRSSLLAGTVTEFRDLQHTTSALLDRALQALDEPDMAAFLQSVMPLLKGIEESSDFSCVRVPEEDYEKLDDFAVNFDKELEALQKLDFVKEEEEEEIVEEEEEEEEDEEEEEEELVPCESRQNIEEERELQNRGTEEIENAEGSDDIKEEDEDKETVERVMEDVASASAFLTPESELAFKFDDSRSTQLQVETSSHVWTFDDQSQSEENATEMERGTGDGQAEKGVERVSGIDEENKEVMKELVDMKREASAVGNIKTFEVEMKTDQSDEEEEESESTVMERTPVNGKAKETKMKHRKVRNVQEEVKDVKHIGKNTHMMELFEDEKEKVKEQEGIKKKGQSDEQETEEVIIESNGQDDEKDEGAEKLKDAIEKEEDITVEAEERGDDNRGEKKEESITEERGESGVKKLEEGKMVQNRGEVKKSECEAEEIICESEQVGIVFEAEKKGEIEINENEVQGEKTAKVDANQERGKEEKGKAEKTKEGQVGDENGNFIDKTGVRLEYNEDQMIKKEEDEKGEDEVSEIGKVRMEKEELAENEAAEVLGEDFGEKQKDEGVVVLEDDEEGEGLGEGEEAEALGEGKEAEELGEGKEGEGKEAEALGEGKEAEALGEGKEAEALGEGKEAEALGDGEEGDDKEAEALGEGETETLGVEEGAEALGDGEEAEALGEGKEEEELGEGKEAEALGDGEREEELGDCEGAETLGDVEGAETLGAVEGAEPLGEGEEAEALGEGKEAEMLGEGKDAEALGYGEREEALGDGEGAETLGAGEGAETLGDGEGAETLGDGEGAETLGDGEGAEALGDGERTEALGDGEGAEALGDGERAESLGDGEGTEELGNCEGAEALGGEEAEALGDDEGPEELGDDEGAEALGVDKGAEGLGVDDGVEALEVDKGVEALGVDEGVEALGVDEGVETLGDDEFGENEGEEEEEDLGENEPNEEEDLRENEPNEGVEELGENEAEENELGEGEDKLEDKEIGGEKIREDGVEEMTGNGNVDKISKDLMEEEKAHYEVQKDDYEENDKMVDDENSEIEEHKENEAEMKRKKVEDKESINKEEDETEKSEMGRKLDKLNVNDDDEVRVAAKTCVKDTVAQRDRKRKEKGDCIGENIETKILPQGGITAKARAQPFQRDKQKPMADQHKRKEMRIKRTKNKGGKKGEQNLKQNHGTKSEATETGEKEHEETEQDGGDGVQNLEETRKAKGKYDGKKERNSQKEEEMVTEKGEDVAVSSPSNTSPPGPSPSHKSLTGWYQPKALSPSFRAPYPTAKTSPQPQAVTLTNCPLTQAVNSGASSAFHPTPIPQLMTPGLSGPSTDNTLVPKQPAQSLGGMRHEANSSKSQVPQKMASLSQWTRSKKKKNKGRKKKSHK